ncbi:MAG: TetR family transcriptional regulator C-terminal domain-containing protein [Eubacterium sp.]|nr:TetR family transcriptional regulator C-terminal domain-containing protein [Eubacterium sp.]MCM1241050.1 TetR family transcriptional regulator C-terminal domain-containing protein [Lachnospiraceae bacterium]
MKENRRVKYTKMFLNESLLKFLMEKPISRITVTELCKDADVNRSTYYVYFTDPYDQLKKLETEIMVDMAIYVDNIMTEGLHNTKKQKRLMKGILDYIEKKKHVFQVLLTKGSNYDLQRDILSFFGERLFDTTSKRVASDAETILHYKYIYASTGAFGIIYNWLINDSRLSTDEVAEMINDFTSSMRA